MARRKTPDYTVTVVYETDSKEVSRRLTRALLKIYENLDEEERERLCKRSLHDS